MTQQRRNKQMVARPRPASTSQRVEVPKTTCTRCGSTVYALPDGTPRGHMRDLRRGEDGFSDIVPTMTDCA